MSTEVTSEMVYDFLAGMKSNPDIAPYAGKIMEMLEMGFSTSPNGNTFINRKEFEKLCILQCTEEDVCNFFNCNDEQLDKWCKQEYGLTFAEVFAKKKEQGKASLRRKQWALADKNATMAIFLGKNYLGQSDKEQVELSGELGIKNLAALMQEAESSEGDDF